MNESDNLNDLYKHSKKKHGPPSRLKRAVMREASTIQSTQNQADKLKPWGALMAASVTGIVLINIVLFGAGNRQETVQSSDALFVEWHGYEKPTVSRTASLRALKDAHYQDYQQSLSVTAQQRTRLATIQDIDGEWALLDCDKNMIKISEQLVAQLQSTNKLSGDFSVGDKVQLALNQEGYILNIWTNNLKVC